MKKFIISGIVLLLTHLTYAQSPFQIMGKVTDPSLEGRTVFMYGDSIVDTATIRNQKFTIKGNIRNPSKVSLLILSPEGAEPKSLTHNKLFEFYLDKGVTRLKGYNLKDLIAKGNPSQDEFNKLMSKFDKASKKARLNSIFSRRTFTDSLKMMYVEKYPASFVSQNLLIELGHPNFISPNREWVARVFPTLPVIWQQSEAGLKVAKILNATKGIAVGDSAPDFTLKDTNGNSISLSDYKGKYVLLDFWASWCAPCRIEHPKFREAYEKYKDKNFRILAVSLDNVKDKWIKAIDEDHITWTQVSDLLARNGPVPQMYNITSIPMNFLIDPHGKIIAVYLRGDNLLETLDSIL